MRRGVDPARQAGLRAPLLGPRDHRGVKLGPRRPPRPPRLSRGLSPCVAVQPTCLRRGRRPLARASMPVRWRAPVLRVGRRRRRNGPMAGAGRLGRRFPGHARLRVGRATPDAVEQSATPAAHHARADQRGDHDPEGKAQQDENDGQRQHHRCAGEEARGQRAAKLLSELGKNALQPQDVRGDAGGHCQGAEESGNAGGPPQRERRRDGDRLHVRHDNLDGRHGRLGLPPLLQSSPGLQRAKDEDADDNADHDGCSDEADQHEDGVGASPALVLPLPRIAIGALGAQDARVARLAPLVAALVPERGVRHGRWGRELPQKVIERSLLHA
mmetsp:Transcript_15616/g.59281  ORF Transcript_15616/g.59281 Transcript_15616/m.59281 type:complete len:328 (+) Transcript_15616:1404-2387(+)